MSVIEEHLNTVKTFKKQLNCLQNQLKDAAKILIDAQFEQERHSNENSCYDTFPICQLVGMEHPTLLEYFLDYIEDRHETHMSWVHAIVTAIVVDKFDIAIQIAKKVHKSALNEYRWKTHTLWFDLARRCPIEYVKKFVELGLDPTVLSGGEWNAAFYAVQFNRMDIVKYLVEERDFLQHIRHPDNFGRTVMYVMPSNIDDKFVGYLRHLLYDR